MPQSSTNLQQSNSKASLWMEKLFLGSPWLWLLYFSLWMISLIMVPSALGKEVFSDTQEFNFAPIAKHILFLVGALGTTIVVSQIPTSVIRKATLGLLGLAFFLNFWLLIDPIRINGAARWIGIGGITIQPSEFFKLIIVLLAAWLAHDTRKVSDSSLRSRKFICFWIITMIGAGCYVSDNLSTFIILIVTSIICSLIINPPWKILFRYIAILFTAAGIFFTMITITPKDTLQSLPFISRSATWKSRIEDKIPFLQDSATKATKQLEDERRHSLGKYEQEEFAKMAVARGGDNLGVRIGESKLRQQLPMASSDFIYAIIIEEFGIFGAIVIPTLYVLWCILAYKLSRRTKSAYRRSLALAIGFAIPMQALINLIVGSGGLVTGQTLPLVSSGGTSLLISSATMGLLISVSREIMLKESQNKNKAKKNASPTTTQVIEDEQ